MEELDEIRIKESQVKEIISMLKDEFNLTETDEAINSELNMNSNNTNNNKESNNNDEGYNGDTNSVDEEPDDSNNGGDMLTQNLAQTETEIDDEYMTSENDIESDENLRLEKFNETVEFVDKAINFGANALDLSKRGLKKLPKNLLLLENLQVN